MPDLDLELALAGCGRELVFPETPDLAAAVAGRLEHLGRPRRSRVRVLVLAFAIVLAGAGIAAAVGAGLHGLGIAFVDRLPPAGKGLDLGLSVEQREARSLAGFELVVPGPPLGTPDGWFVDSAGSGRVVTLVWRHHPSLPAARDGVSVLVTEASGTLDPGITKQLLSRGARVQFLRVGAGDAVWISGAPHTLSYRTSSGGVATQTVRLVGNVLAWNRGDLLLRLEGAPTLAEARRLAASFR